MRNTPSHLLIHVEMWGNVSITLMRTENVFPLQKRYGKEQLMQCKSVS